MVKESWVSLHSFFPLELFDDLLFRRAIVADKGLNVVFEIKAD